MSEMMPDNAALCGSAALVRGRFARGCHCDIMAIRRTGGVISHAAYQMFPGLCGVARQNRHPFSEAHWQLRILHHLERPEYGRESDVKFTPALTSEEQQLADGIAEELFKRRVCDDEED